MPYCRVIRIVLVLNTYYVLSYPPHSGSLEVLLFTPLPASLRSYWRVRPPWYRRLSARRSLPVAAMLFRLPLSVRGRLGAVVGENRASVDPGPPTHVQGPTWKHGQQLASANALPIVPPTPSQSSYSSPTPRKDSGAMRRSKSHRETDTMRRSKSMRDDGSSKAAKLRKTRSASSKPLTHTDSGKGFWRSALFAGGSQKKRCAAGSPRSRRAASDADVQCLACRAASVTAP